MTRTRKMKPKIEQSQRKTGNQILKHNLDSDISFEHETSRALSHLKSSLGDITVPQKSTSSTGSTVKITSQPIEQHEVLSHSSHNIHLSSVYSSKDDNHDNQGLSSNTSCEKSKSSVVSSLPSDTGCKPKILLLRKQLEENRIKFEKQKRENSEKRAAMEEMSQRIERLRTDIQERDDAIHSLRDSDMLKFNPDFQHLYQQIVCKDNSILALSDKVLQLENTIQSQTEELAEKDEIIKAKKEAVSIICKDKDEKFTKTNNDIYELRQEINLLQNQFSNERTKWNEKELSLESVIKEKSKKISLLEENYQRIESIRFELSIRNGELQEKLVSQQSDMQALRAELEVSKTQLQNKINEISSLNKMVLKAETFGQKKLRNMEKHIKGVFKDSDMCDKFLQLQNNISELQEENGTLQLKLVDSDDIISLNNELKQSLSKAENKIEKLNCEILSHISSISQKENEQIGLIEQTNQMSIRFGDLKQANDVLQNEIDNLKQQNIILELKLCEIEEERDIALKKINLEIEDKEINDSKDSNVESSDCNELDELSRIKLEFEKKALTLSTLEKIISEKEVILEEVLKEKEEKFYENESLVTLLAEKEELMLSQNHEIEKHESYIVSLEENLKEKEMDAKNLVDNINTLQSEIKCLKNNLHDNNVIVSKLNSEIKKFEKEISANAQSLSILRKSESALACTVQEKENIIENLQEEINNIRIDLNQKQLNLMELRDRIGILEAALQSKEKLILNLESDIADKLNENSQQASMSDKFKHEIENVKAYYQQIRTKLEEELNRKSSILLRRENEVKELQEEMLIMSNNLDSSSVIASKYEKEICSKNLLYEAALTKNSEFEAMIKDLEDKITEMNSEQRKSNLSNICNLQSLLEEKTRDFEELVDAHKNLTANHSYLEMQLKLLEAENINLTKQLKAKEEENEKLNKDYYNFIQIKKDEISHQNSLISEKEGELNHLLETREQSILELKHSLELLNNELFEKKREMANLDIEMNLVKKKLEQSQNDINVMEQTLALKESDIATYISDLDWYKAKYDETLFSLQILQEKMDMQSQIQNTEVELEYDSKPITSDDSNSQDATMQSNLSLLGVECEKIKHSKESKLLYSLHKERDISAVNLLTVNDEDFENCKEREQKIYEQTIIKDLDSNLTVMEKSAILSGNLENSASFNEDEFIKVKTKQELDVKKILCSQLKPEKEKLQSKTAEIFPRDSYISCPSVNLELVNLKKELAEAHQAIACLETSLATQSTVDNDFTRDSSEEWRVVDLGKSPTHPCSSMIENSLHEKNKTLCVIQEQLKNALEDINITVNEKKVLIHQINNLESTIIDKDNTISVLQQQVLDLNKNIQDLNGKIDKPQSLIKENGKSNLLSISNIPADYWSEVSSTANLTREDQSDFHLAQNDGRDSAEISKNEFAQCDLGRDELYFKLSWYEENWPTLTMHYNQLKANFEIAEEQIIRLNEDLRKYNNDHIEQELEGSSTIVCMGFKSDENKLEPVCLDRNEVQVIKLQNQVEAIQQQVNFTRPFN